MSSIRLLHRSLSLLPLQCCNCNNHFAYILLLITSLLSTLCGTQNSVSKKNNNNNKSCLCQHNHQQQQQEEKESSVCNNNNSYRYSIQHKTPNGKYSCVDFTPRFRTASSVSTSDTVKAVKVITNSGCQTSDTYILAPHTTTVQLSDCSNYRSSSVSRNCSEKDCKLQIIRDRRLKQRPQQEDQQPLYPASACWFEKNKRSNYRNCSSSSSNNQNSDSDCCRPQKTLSIQSNTNTNNRKHSINITIIADKKAVVAATVIASTFVVDLTYPSFYPKSTPQIYYKDSSFTSKHLVNNHKPFSSSPTQRLLCGSSTPLLEENNQSTHSKIDLCVSTSLHVLVQQRKSTSQPRKPQHLVVGARNYA